MQKKKQYRIDAIAEAYTKGGLFKPEIVAYGNQILYEMEQDLNAMRWALNRIDEFLQVAKKYDYFTGTLHIAKDELVKRISKYSCPSNLKDEYKTKEKCPLKENCKCLQGVSSNEETAKDLPDNECPHCHISPLMCKCCGERL